MLNPTVLARGSLSAITALRGLFLRHGTPLLCAVLASLLIGGTFVVIQPIVYTNDSEFYLEGARWFAAYPDGKYSYWRTPLYLVMMALTGVAQGLTLKLLVLVQGMMALSIPLLIYFTLAWLNRWVACAISVAASASLIPFLNAGLIMPHQLYFFLVALTTWSAAHYLHTRNHRVLYALGLLCFATVMVRPQGSYLYLVFFAVTLLYQRRHFKHWAASLVLLLVLQTGYMALRPYFVKKISGNASVLIPDSDRRRNLIPSDQRLFARGMTFLKNNLYSDARFLKEMIQSSSLRNAFDFALVNRYLLNNEPGLAIDAAVAISDRDVRIEALHAIYARSIKSGDRLAANTAFDHIDDAKLRARPDAFGLIPHAIIDYSEMAAPGEQLAPRRYVQGLDLTNTSGKMLLFPVLWARNLYPQALLRPENGQSTALLFKLIEAYWESHPEIMAAYPTLRPFTGNAAAATRYLLTSSPDPFEPHWTIFIMMDDILGPERGDLLCRAVYLEFMRSNLRAMLSLYALKTLENLWSPSGGPSAYLLADITADRPFATEIAASKRFANVYINATTLAIYDVVIDRAAMPLSVAAALVVVFLFAAGALLRMWLMLWGVALHQIAVCVVTVGGGFGYVALSYVFILMAFGVGLCGAAMLWRKRRENALPARPSPEYS